MENELEQLLDNYFKARSIKVDDQRTIAGGVAEMTQAEMAIEQYVTKAYNAALEAAIGALPEGKETVWSYSGEEDPEVTGWNAYADQARAAIEGLKSNHD